MTAPLTKTREKKVSMLLGIIETSSLMLTYPRGSLDMMDLRILKQITKKLNELQERSKPL